jgi:hypothetical protein
VRAGTRKVHKDFFGTEFHDVTQDHESNASDIMITQHHEYCVSTTSTKVMIIKKKKFADDDV